MILLVLSSCLVPVNKVENETSIKTDDIEYVNTTHKYALENNVNWKIMHSIFEVESNMNANAIGDSGKAFGLGQVHMSTAKIYDKKITKEKLMNPDVNVKISSMLLRDYLKRYNNKYEYAIAAYNIGPVKIDKHFKTNTAPPNYKYVFKVLINATKI
jgi:soluble lytic murein transglycosylase-like protein